MGRPRGRSHAQRPARGGVRGLESSVPRLGELRVLAPGTDVRLRRHLREVARPIVLLPATVIAEPSITYGEDTGDWSASSAGVRSLLSRSRSPSPSAPRQWSSQLAPAPSSSQLGRPPSSWTSAPALL